MKAKPLTLIVISWDGHSQPFSHLTIDAEPQFQLLLFDYSGTRKSCANAPLPCSLLSQQTECKGQIFVHIASYLNHFNTTYDYIALIDDDVEISVSGFNTLLEIAEQEKFDSFAPALSGDSYHSHKQFLQQPHRVWHAVPWVEVMMPFYRYELFLAAVPHFAGSISSYGIDQFVFAMMQHVTGMNHVAVIDAVIARHKRAITSHNKIYFNGMTAAAERRHIRKACMNSIARDHPNSVGSDWYYQTFAPLNGPVRFWGPYLLWPFYKLKRMFVKNESSL